MKKILFRIFLIFTLSVPFIAHAQNNKYTPVVTYGLHRDGAHISCSTFLAENTEIRWQSYIAGYITACNHMRARDYEGVNLDGLRAWLTNYCQQHPTEPFANALNSLDTALGVGKRKVSKDKTAKKGKAN